MVRVLETLIMWNDRIRLIRIWNWGKFASSSCNAGWQTFMNIYLNISIWLLECNMVAVRTLSTSINLKRLDLINVEFCIKIDYITGNASSILIHL